MAEHRNIDAGPSPGVPVAVDVDGQGDEWQRIKVGYGPDGSPADVTTANPLPVVQTGTPGLPTGAATAALQTAEATLVGAVTETAPASDTASSGLNGRLQRIAQRLTSLIALLPTSLGQKTMANGLAVTVASDQTVIPVSDNGGSLTVDGSVTANIGTVGTLATEATQTAQSTLYGAVNETAPASDTASSGLNGRLQRIAQNITTLLGRVPAALGQTTKAGSLSVTLASNQDALPITDNAGSLTVDNGGTFAVQDALAETALGAPTDAAATTTGSVIAQLRRIANELAGTLTVTGGGGGTQFAEDSVHASGDLGTMALGVRKDTAASLAGTDGDYTAPIFDSTGKQHVNVGASVLPTGAATAAKQPALGTAGSPSADVVTVQGPVGGLEVTVLVIDDIPLAPDAATETSLSSVLVGVGDPADAAATTTGSIIAQLRRIANELAGTLTISGAVTTTPPANASTNLAQVAGATTATGHGTASGALRVELPTDGTGVVGVSSSALPTGAATSALQSAEATLIGAVTETAPASDTASSGLNGRLQRIAQRLTTLLAGGLPAALGANGGLKIEGVASGTVVPVSDGGGSLTVDNSGTFAVQDSQKLADNAAFTDGTTPVQPVGFVFDEVAGTALTENDVAAGRVDSKRAQVGVVEDATTRGQRLAVSAAGAAKVDGSAVTQPVSAAALPLPSGAATEATLAAQTKVDNAAFTDGTTPVSPVGYVFDEVAGTALTENDVAAARIDSKRGQVSVLEDATTRGQRAAVSAAGRLSVDASGVAVPITDNSGSLTVDNAGTFAVQPTQPSASTGAVTAFTATTSTVIFSSNASAKLRSFRNDSNAILYLMFRAAAASVTAYHEVVGPGDVLHTDYTGEVRGIMSATISTGQVNCGEFT